MIGWTKSGQNLMYQIPLSLCCVLSVNFPRPLLKTSAMWRVNLEATHLHCPAQLFLFAFGPLGLGSSRCLQLPAQPFYTQAKLELLGSSHPGPAEMESNQQTFSLERTVPRYALDLIEKPSSAQEYKLHITEPLHQGGSPPCFIPPSPLLELAPKPAGNRLVTDTLRGHCHGL